MKEIITFFLCCLMYSAQAQFTNLKTRNTAQDSVLEMVFQKYLKANDSVADLRNIEMIHNFSDSADKYTAKAMEYLQGQRLDSCIWMIHVSNFYITNTKVLLHIKKSDEYHYEVPKY